MGFLGGIFWRALHTYGGESDGARASTLHKAGQLRRDADVLGPTLLASCTYTTDTLSSFCNFYCALRGEVPVGIALGAVEYTALRSKVFLVEINSVW